MTPSEHRPVEVGWTERVDFPDWGLRRVRAKIDTGARTSAIDAPGCVLIESPGGLMAQFRLAPYRKRPDLVFPIRAPVTRLVTVKNSGGEPQRRAEVETTIRLGPVTKRIRLTLTDRAKMRFPLILGRTTLAGDFVVDVQRKNMQRRNS
ncbi:MAG: ATP-dependent zinc protease [Gemmataceae bacterium]